MNKYKLAEELKDFCFYNQIFGNTKEEMSVDKIVDQLEEIWFVEHLIHTFIVKAKYKENIDIKKLKELLLQLEEIRLDLEYDE